MVIPRKSFTVALVLAVVLSAFVVVPRPVAAAQNHPTWTQGDYWVYTRTAGSARSTIRIDVYEKTTITLGTGTYSVWHVTTTTTDANGNTAILHSWVDDSNLGMAKATISFGSFGTVNVTFDPPQAEAQFPLSTGATWSLSTKLTIVNTSISVNVPYSASVTAEQSTTVTAGTFNVAVITTPATGTPQRKDSYSDSAGNHVRRESFASNGTRTEDQELTSFRYQASTLFLILIVVAVLVIAAVAVGVFVTLRRRRRGAQPGAPPPPPPPTQ